MKPRTFVAGFLLLFALGSAAFVLFQGSASTPFLPAATVEPKKEEAPDRVVAYYFYGSIRCATCRRLEAYAREALESGFPQELARGRLEWRPINVDRPENKHFISDYQLRFRSLVLAQRHDGQQKQWKNLEEVWKLVNDKDAYIAYVQREAREYLADYP